MKRLGLDLDGVIYDFDKSFNKWMRKKGYFLINKWIYKTEERYPTLTKEKANKLIKEFSETRQMRKLEMYPNALEVIGKLREDYYIWIITNREPTKKIKKNTLTQIKNDGLSDLVKECIFCDGVHKSVLANTLRLDYFVDDYKENLKDILANSLTKPIQMVREYNQFFKSKMIPRVHDWDELFKFLW